MIYLQSLFIYVFLVQMFVILRLLLWVHEIHSYLLEFMSYKSQVLLEISSLKLFSPQKSRLIILQFAIICVKRFNKNFW